MRASSDEFFESDVISYTTFFWQTKLRYLVQDKGGEPESSVVVCAQYQDYSHVNVTTPFGPVFPGHGSLRVMV